MPLYGNLFQSSFGSNAINLLSDTIKVMLCTSSYAPNQDTHQFKSSVTNEVTGTGYTAGGQALASKSYSYTSGSHVNTFSAANTTWTSATITARYAVIYKDTGTASTSPLLAYVDFVSDQTSTNGNFTLQWNASGIMTITCS